MSQDVVKTMKNYSNTQSKLQHSLMCGVWAMASATVCCDSWAAAGSVQGYVMQVQMTPAVCALDHTSRKQRKCLEGYSLTITGLIPETNQSNCSTHSSAKLSPLQDKVVAQVMPDQNARNRLWATVGGCTGGTASQYFRGIINKAEKLKIPVELTGVDNRMMQLSHLKSQFFKLNPQLLHEAIRFNCQSHQNQTYLTEMQICYKSSGQYKACSAQVISTCPTSFYIKGSY